MSNFESAVNYSLLPENEGGYVNDPDDPGGETNHGISKRFMDSHPNDPLCLIPVKDLTIDQAKQLYFKYFWQPYHLDKVNSLLLSIKVFDFGINSGPQTAIKLLQQAYNDIYPSKEIIVDGQLGSETENAINNCEISKVLNAFINQIIRHYKLIAQENPADKKDLDGWINRARRIP